MKRSLSRRSLLTAVGASALCVPLLNERFSYAQSTPFPKRIFFVVTSNGTIPQAFWPSGEGASFTLPEICSPLEAYKSKLLFPRGIDLTVWTQDNPFGGNGDSHHNYGSILTGTQLATGDAPHDPGGPGLALASSESLDIHLGKILGERHGSSFPTLNVRARGADGNGSSCVSWAGDRAPVTSERDPQKLFETLFYGYTPEGPDPEFLKAQKKRKSILDYVGKSLERQATHLGKEDRHKIDLHLSAVRGIELQLERREDAAYCEPPSAVPSADYQRPEMFSTYVDLQIDLMVAAMACDMNRVSTFVISDSSAYDTYFPFLDIVQTGIEFPTRHQHDIAHRPGENNHDKIEVEKWHMTKFERLLSKLDSVPEGDGTMLDNTCILWLNSMNDGFSHTVLNLPIIVAAGANIPIRTGGRVLNAANTPHNLLLTALANAMDVPMTSWGDPRYPGVLDLS